GTAHRRARRCPQRLRPGRIGAALGELDRCPESVGGPDQRAHVARISHPPERQGNRPRRERRQIVAPKHSDDARRMRQRRDLREQLRQHGLTGDEHLDRLDPRLHRSLDKILPLPPALPELVAPPARVELADELERLVPRRGDQAGSSADFAFSAIAAKASGSETARSASTLRSSPISAFRHPAMNWLYESPFWRAAALMRRIQSRRNSRLRFFRSRYA